MPTGWKKLNIPILKYGSIYNTETTAHLKRLELIPYKFDLEAWFFFIKTVTGQ